MFEREIQKAKEQLTKALASELPYVYWFEVQEHKTLHNFYKTFFGAEVQWWVFEQQMLRAANPRFDYTHEQLAYHLSLTDRYYAESARFDHQDLAAAIDLAVKTRFNYVLRPRTTLRWFIYRGEPTKTLQEVLLRLQYFSEYDYLPDGFRAWATNKREEIAGSDDALKTGLLAGSGQGARQEIISVVEFDRILQSADNSVILDFSPTQFLDLLAPIYELFAEVYAGSTDFPKGSVPTTALIIFLDDKGIYPIAQDLERLLKDEQKRFLNRKDFFAALTDIIGRLENEAQHGAFSDTATLPLTFEEAAAGGANDAETPPQETLGT